MANSALPPACPVSVEAAAYPCVTASTRAPYEMAPLQPPLPTAMNFPFQPVAGIHTSILMSESLLGTRVALTRQNAGRSRMGPRPPGGVKPAATDSAPLILTSARDIEPRLSQ